jgi:hypothetical protein
VLFSGVGCQCCGLTDRYADGIDDYSDGHLCFEDLYNPTLDLTRIGHSDWYQSRLNRKLCSRCQKNHFCESCQEYHE